MKDNDTGVILIYDTRGTIAGVQIAVSDRYTISMHLIFFVFIVATCFYGKKRFV
jgi:hypothetical protein